jgi:hypothetical protein
MFCLDFRCNARCKITLNYKLDLQQTCNNYYGIQLKLHWLLATNTTNTLADLTL